ncbi:hypothetical protein M404DRAFT_10681 [Pisolithus tinctorius Marx 270]|uniref:Uncharacterized protein n=1 Tax=Pisolithus tinctorius Marx 270 TaxID=870435 RepID=A0A0C3N9U6_PISTI|nr:hypothetical protein M404DRAFT_10681 [Pisolithus tinctorius Marx 270]
MLTHPQDPIANTQTSVLQADSLDPIAEDDEPYDFTALSSYPQLDTANLSNASHLGNAQEFVSIITGTDGRDYNYDMEIDEYDMKSQEDFNLDILGTSDDESNLDSGSDEELETQILQQRPNLKQVVPHIPAKQKQVAGFKFADNGKASTKPIGSYNPEEQKKIRRYLGQIKLQYQLDSDKVKAGSISIQTDDKLDIFKARMRSLIVPKCLPSGKPSTHPMKTILIYFEDAGGEDSHLSAGDGNKVGSKGSGPSSKWNLSSTRGELIDNEEQEKIVAALQECWSPGEKTVCYPLTHSNIAFWALQIKLCY